MSDKVYRYDFSDRYGVEKKDDGDFVRFEDYEQLTKELEEAHRAIADHLTKRGEYKAEVDKFREPLQALVDLKEMKDRFGKTDAYRTLQPLAWKRAKEALQSSDTKQENER